MKERRHWLIRVHLDVTDDGYARSDIDFTIKKACYCAERAPNNDSNAQFQQVFNLRSRSTNTIRIISSARFPFKAMFYALIAIPKSQNIFIIAISIMKPSPVKTSLMSITPRDQESILPE
jgi:hypothetical protein